jgi:hypothetical protein
MALWTAELARLLAVEQPFVADAPAGQVLKEAQLQRFVYVSTGGCASTLITEMVAATNYWWKGA